MLETITENHKKGIVVPLITPLSKSSNGKNGKNLEFGIDTNSFGNLIRYVESERVQGIFVNSTTGEFYDLSMEQKKKSIDIAKAKAKTLVFAGTTGKTLQETVELTKYAEKRGADVAVIMPFYFYPHNRGLPHVMKEITSQAKIPILLYNNPHLTKNDIKTSIFKRILVENKNVIGIKDSSGEWNRLMNYKEAAKHKKGSMVFQGDESLIFESIIYGCGAVPSIANISPQCCAQMWYSHIDGETARMGYYKDTLNWIKNSFRDTYFYKNNTAPIIKKVLKLKGIINNEDIFKTLSKEETKRVEEESHEIKSKLERLGK